MTDTTADTGTRCTLCGAAFPVHPIGYAGGTGYAIRPDGTRICYACADDQQRAEMINASEVWAYVSSDGTALTTWSGGQLASVVPHTGSVSRTGWHGSAIYAWRFVAPDGSHWHGRNGGPGMCIRARRARR